MMLPGRYEIFDQSYRFFSGISFLPHYFATTRLAIFKGSANDGLI
jgi:hypothetical protein